MSRSLPEAALKKKWPAPAGRGRGRPVALAAEMPLGPGGPPQHTRWRAAPQLHLAETPTPWAVWNPVCTCRHGCAASGGQLSDGAGHAQPHRAAQHLKRLAGVRVPMRRRAARKLLACLIVGGWGVGSALLGQQPAECAPARGAQTLPRPCAAKRLVAAPTLWLWPRVPLRTSCSILHGARAPAWLTIRNASALPPRVVSRHAALRRSLRCTGARASAPPAIAASAAASAMHAASCGMRAGGAHCCGMLRSRLQAAAASELGAAPVAQRARRTPRRRWLSVQCRFTLSGHQPGSPPFAVCVGTSAQIVNMSSRPSDALQPPGKRRPGEQLSKDDLDDGEEAVGCRSGATRPLWVRPGTAPLLSACCPARAPQCPDPGAWGPDSKADEATLARRKIIRAARRGRGDGGGDEAGGGGGGTGGGAAPQLAGAPADDAVAPANPFAGRSLVAAAAAAPTPAPTPAAAPAAGAPASATVDEVRTPHRPDRRGSKHPARLPDCGAARHCAATAHACMAAAPHTTAPPPSPRPACGGASCQHRGEAGEQAA